MEGERLVFLPAIVHGAAGHRGHGREGPVHLSMGLTQRIVWGDDQWFRSNAPSLSMRSIPDMGIQDKRPYERITRSAQGACCELSHR